MFTRPLKRKRNDLGDQYDDADEDRSSDDEPSLGKQMLPVARSLPEDFDGIPQDGMQYLLTVRQDAMRLPHTTRVVNPYAVVETKPMLSIAGPSPHHPALPPEEWRSLIETRFQNLRKNLSQPTIHVEIPEFASSKPMPDIKERALWWEFLAGKPECDWNPPKKAKKQRKFGQGMRAFSPPPHEYEITLTPVQTSTQDNIDRVPLQTTNTKNIEAFRRALGYSSTDVLHPLD